MPQAKAAVLRKGQWQVPHQASHWDVVPSSFTSLTLKRHPHTPTDRLFCSSALPTKNFSKFPAQKAPGPAGGAGQAGSEALTTASSPEPLV